LQKVINVDANSQRRALFSISLHLLTATTSSFDVRRHTKSSVDDAGVDYSHRVVWLWWQYAEGIRRRQNYDEAASSQPQSALLVFNGDGGIAHSCLSLLAARCCGREEKSGKPRALFALFVASWSNVLPKPLFQRRDRPCCQFEYKEGLPLCEHLQM
jgi:hypothetical protein